MPNNDDDDDAPTCGAAIGSIRNEPVFVFLRIHFEVVVLSISVAAQIVLELDAKDLTPAGCQVMNVVIACMHATKYQHLTSIISYLARPQQVEGAQ